jgi:hypothetical protein
MTSIIVTPEMTVQTLIDAGVTLAQVQSLLAPKTQSTANVDRAAFAEEIFGMMCADAQANWKNGKLLKNWFAGKQSDPELEKARVKRHQIASQKIAPVTQHQLHSIASSKVLFQQQLRLQLMTRQMTLL